MKKCLFVDIDGTIIKNIGSLTNIIRGRDKDYVNEYNAMGELLPGVIEKFNKWAELEYHIVITTARPKSMKKFTIKQLQYHGLFFNDILFNLPRGERHLLNDTKPATNEYPELITAVAHPLKRNEGLINVEI